MAAVLVPVSAIAKEGLTPYGHIKFDASYDEARIDPGNYARWVESEATRENDPQFNTTANHSILGLLFHGDEYGRTRTYARVEVDFYGGGAENGSNIMMRHAYVEISWPESDFSILAGQTNDVVSPLTPGTLNYSAAWWAGDIGYWRPQLRFTKGFRWGNQSRLVFEAAAVRTIGDPLTYSPGDTGEDAAIPSFQGRVAVTFPMAGQKAVLGFSGHSGKEEYDYDAANNSEQLDSWSTNVEWVLPLSGTVAVRGEWWQGENLDAYLGGIAQGVVIETGTGKYTDGKNLEGDYVGSWGVQSTGGWAGLEFGPYESWRFGFGASYDDPEDADLVDGSRSRNQSWYGNVRYSISKAVQMGFEYSQWNTEYKNQPDGDSYRLQHSILYNF
jgi:hypothetical protein